MGCPDGCCASATQAQASVKTKQRKSDERRRKFGMEQEYAGVAAEKAALIHALGIEPRPILLVQPLDVVEEPVVQKHEQFADGSAFALLHTM